MINVTQIEIIPVEDIPELERINAQLKTLVLAHEGTIPGSRGFGLPGDFLDLPDEEALNVFAIELEQKVEEYIPEISIAGVTGHVNLEGVGDVSISVERREETTDGTD